MTPYDYAKKIQALKYLDKKLKQIEDKGSTLIKIGCTGYSYTVQKGDIYHLDMKAKREAYAAEINAYQLIRAVPSPVSVATPDVEARAAARRAKRAEYARRYYAKKKAQAK